MRVQEVAYVIVFLWIPMCLCLQICLTVCVCPWLAISAATSPANEFNSSVLWPGFILQRENPPLQLESSLWPWQTVICQESTSLEFSFCHWLQWIELSMCWKYWNPPKYWHDSEEPAYCCPACVYADTVFLKFLIVFALFTHMYSIISRITCAPPHWMLNPVPPGSQPCRSSEPFICSAVCALQRQLIQTSARL